MEIRRILVNFDLDKFSPALAATAVGLAQRFGAELVGFAAAVPSPVFAGVHGAIAAASIYAEQRLEMERQLSALQSAFTAAMPATLKTQWRQMVETPNRALTAVARSVDLVLTGPQGEQNPSPLRNLDIGTAVLGLGRPVVVVGAGTQEIKADKIVIGWKDTREARRAVVDALPFLKAASAVRIIAIEEGDFATAKPSLADALDWLRTHDVKATSDMVPAAFEGLSTTIDNIRREFGADLVVTGAYGRSRLEEWLLGGMTRDLIAATYSNRFMAN